MAVVTTALFFQYMKNMNTTNATVSTSVINTKEVVVAAEQIEKNERISAEKLKVILVDENHIHPQAILSIDEVVDKTATAIIAKEEQILSHRIISDSEESTFVSRKIKEGYRAVSVGVNINQSVTNLIEPEDDVDVIFTKKVKKNGNEVAVSRMILTNIRVLAIGRKLVNSEDSVEPYVEYSSVTLELKPEDALSLVRSSEEGSIHFILHQRPVETSEEKSN